MTNYEWIMESGKMGNFLLDVNNALNENARGKFPLSIEGQYHGLSIEYGENILKKCVEWLQAERKTITYVALDDVICLLKKPIICGRGMSFSEAIGVRIQEIANLPTKEIDE